MEVEKLVAEEVRGSKDVIISVAEAPQRIRALSQDVVNKIAAGEIIVAPVHALKELTENAVDAGSTSLEILVKDGGLRLLQITDNGHGINRDDMPILCERFTTSKLKTFEDLTSIGTYGFRGEALASISHIAHLQITTKTRESSCAWRAHYSDGKLSPAKPGQTSDPKACAGRQGTQITVEDLFYNVPTRRRAFRSASEEYNKILDLVGRYAIHCSGVAFSCKKHGDASTSISIAAHANTVDRIRQIHGSAVASQLLDLSIESDCWGFKSSGWISNANYHVKKLILMLFINHRSVESSTIKKAVEQTYALFLPKGGHPFIYLSLEIDPHRLDVNVHPTKREVNFLNEDEIIETVCEEIRVRLGKVDDSRTFFTQSLIPGVNIPTISRNSTIESVQDLDPPDTPSTAAPMPMQSTKRTPASRPYENNLVRTDSKARKITTMFSTTPRVDSPTRRLSEDPRNATPSTYQADGVGLLLEDVNTYSYVDREYVICRLSTIKELKANVRLSMHNAMTEIFTSHIFVGVVDEHRRIAAIQSGVKLFLVDYGMLCNEYFYQLGLTDFGNFGTIKLEPSLNLRELLKIAAESEEQNTPQEDAEGMDWKEVVDTVHDHLVERRQMIAEYFSVNISAEGDIHGLPLLVKGYMPSMGKLPQFLLRLGPHVDWTDEKACFRTFLRELASWYVPEALPVTQTQPEEDPNGMNRNEMDTNENETYATLKEAKAVGRRKDINRALEHVIFPAFKARLIGTKGMLKGIVEVADLKGLYRVFERC